MLCEAGEVIWSPMRIKSNADIWDCKDVNPGNRRWQGYDHQHRAGRGTLSLRWLHQIPRSTFSEIQVGEGSERWGVNLLVLEENGKESKVTVRYDNSLIGVQRFNLSSAMTTWDPEWEGIHRCKLDIYVWRQKEDKVVLNYVKAGQTDKEASRHQWFPYPLSSSCRTR